MPVIMASWRWCDRCQGLWSAANGPQSSCPAGGPHHIASTSGSYALWGLGGGDAPWPGYQTQWTWCTRCQAVFYGPNQASSNCPAGGHHTSPLVGPYEIAVNTSAPGQPGWAWCKNCQVLFYGPYQSSSRCSAAGGGPHDSTGSGNYTVPFGDYPEMLNIVVQNQSDHYFRLASSPDGTLANLSLRPDPMFGTEQPRDQSGGVIAAAVAPPYERIFYACRSNEGSNNVMIGSIGLFDASINPPVSTGLGIIGDPNPSAPALVFFKGKLFLFYRPWWQGQGNGQTTCVPITILDNAGNFTVGTSVAISDLNGGGRISAVATSSQIWCSWVETTNPNAAGWLNAAYSPDGIHWTNQSAAVGGSVNGSPCLIVMPTGQVAAGWWGPSATFYFSIYNPGGGGYWPYPAQTVPGPTPQTEPSWMTSADNSCIYLAHQGVNNCIRVHKLAPDASAVLETAQVDNIAIANAPALVCLFAGGTPPDPP
jgi:hypothetical protein